MRGAAGGWAQAAELEASELRYGPSGGWSALSARRGGRVRRSGRLADSSSASFSRAVRSHNERLTENTLWGYWWADLEPVANRYAVPPDAAPTSDAKSKERCWRGRKRLHGFLRFLPFEGLRVEGEPRQCHLQSRAEGATDRTPQLYRSVSATYKLFPSVGVTASWRRGALPPLFTPSGVFELGLSALF